jgi:hypothetical protein
VEGKYFHVIWGTTATPAWWNWRKQQKLESEYLVTRAWLDLVTSGIKFTTLSYCPTLLRYNRPEYYSTILSFLKVELSDFHHTSMLKYIEITFNRLLCELYRNIRLHIHTVNIAGKSKWMWWIKRTTALCILPSYKVLLQYEEEIYAFLWPQEDIRKSAGQPFYLRADFFTQRTQRPSWSSDASFFIFFKRQEKNFFH